MLIYWLIRPYFRVLYLSDKEKGIVLGAVSIEKNDYDEHTLSGALKQFKEINGYEPKRAIVDLGYKGIDKIGTTEVVRPDNGKGKSKYLRCKMKVNHRKRAGIEAKISHLKNDYRMNKNFYKGIIGDKLNVFLAASLNFKIWMSDYKRRVKYFWFNLIIAIKLISNPILLVESRYRTA